MPNPNPERIAEYEPLIGKVTIAWNDVQYAIFGIFKTLVDHELQIAEAIFFSPKNDRTQRDLAKAAINQLLAPEAPAIAAKISALITSVDSLAGRRNDVTHGIWVIQFPTLDVQIFPQKNRLNKKDIKVELWSLVLDIRKIGLELLEAHLEIMQLPSYKQRALAAALREAADELSAEGKLGLLSNLSEPPTSR